MDTINSPDDMMDFVANVAKRAVNKHFENIEQNTIKELQELVSLVTGREPEKDVIGFEICDDNSSIIVPKNLYTLLLMSGVFVDYEQVKNSDDYVTDCGTYYTFNPRSSVQYKKNGELIEVVNCFVNI